MITMAGRVPIVIGHASGRVSYSPSAGCLQELFMQCPVAAILVGMLALALLAGAIALSIQTWKDGFKGLSIFCFFTLVPLSLLLILGITGVI